MAPSAIETVTEVIPDPKAKLLSNSHSKPASSYISDPLKKSGALDEFRSFEVTPVIGREYPIANLVEWMNAPNSDALLRELAITISQRGVVFFRGQNELTNDLQKQLILRLGELTGRPKESTLHIHPILNSARELGGSDAEISTISSTQFKQLYNIETGRQSKKKQSGKIEWHSDITFERVPADYTCLRLSVLPETGGDTMWASGYDLYDRISAPYQKFLESLTATFAQPSFNETAKRNGFEVYEKPRGNPANVGSDLSAVHPVVRTNPLTGWKSIFAVGAHCQHINDITEAENKHLLNWFLDLLTENHDLQVRFKWLNKNDFAIWDNRSVYHAATYDYEGERFGERAVGIGERPFFDPASVSRSEALHGMIG